VARNLVVLCDGTGNEPKLAGNTNVYRLFEMLGRDDEQLVWYDAGVGTLASPKAITRVTRSLTKIAGLAAGYGLKHNVVAGYQFLMRHHEPGDRIYLFGFSRGAYTARAIAGLLYQIGLLRPEQENMVPYALKLFWWQHGGRTDESVWKRADAFSSQFSRSDFERRRRNSVQFVGLWDTVNATGFLRQHLVLPWTAKMPMARSVRHAVSIHERRRPFKPQLLAHELEEKKSGAFKEVWFSGVHTDVGGTFLPDHRLADITLEWVASAAAERGLRVKDTALRGLASQPMSDADGEIHHMGWKWWPVSVGYRRPIPAGAVVHESVLMRSDAAARTLPPGVEIAPWSRGSE